LFSSQTGHPQLVDVTSRFTVFSLVLPSLATRPHMRPDS